MYLKRHVVRRGEKRYVYLRLVQSYRNEAGKVRHRVLTTLGREEELKASGQLEQLAAAFTRADPPTPGTRREVGPLLLVAHYLDRLGLRQIVDRAIPQRGRARLTCGEVVCALVANRLASPAPLYDVAGWAEQAAMREVFGVPGALLNDDRLGRALDALAPVAEQVRGAATLAAVDRCGAEAARLHVDLTTLRFSGAYPDSRLVAKGWGPDRRVARQVRVLEATNPDGIPLYVRPRPGSAAELTLIGEALERLVELLPPGLLVCADSALGYPRSLCHAHRAGVSFIVPLREDSGFRRRFLEEVGHEGLHPLRYVSRRDRGRPQKDRTRYRGTLRPFEVQDPETKELHRSRVAYIWSSEEARSVAEGRERALANAVERLERVRRASGGATTGPRSRWRPRWPGSSPRSRGSSTSRSAPGRGAPPCRSAATRWRSPRPGPPTGSTPWPPTSRGGSPPPGCFGPTRTRPSLSGATGISRGPSGSARCSCTPTRGSRPSSGWSGSPSSCSGSSRPTSAAPSVHKRRSPVCSRRVAPPAPPGAASSPPSRVSASPTPPTASSSTGSPPRSAGSSTPSALRSHGPNREGKGRELRKTGLARALRGHDRVAVDTAPLVYFLGGHAPRDALVDDLLARAAAGELEVVASVVTEAELLVGALRAGSREAALVGQLFDGPAVRVVPVSRQVARRAAELRAGHGLRMVDAVVAATALEEGCTALVGNDRASRRLVGQISYVHLDDLVDGSQEPGPPPGG